MFGEDERGSDEDAGRPEGGGRVPGERGLPPAPGGQEPRPRTQGLLQEAVRRDPPQPERLPHQEEEEEVHGRLRQLQRHAHRLQLTWYKTVLRPCSPLLIISTFWRLRSITGGEIYNNVI